MIKLEMLRAFITVAEAGNIKDAAERLFRTPSALSMTLKQLETEVGGPLFETDRKNSLTALGTFLLETARVQVNSYDRAVGRIQAFAQNRIGRLTLASVPSVAANLVPALLPDFVAERPGIQIELFDIDSRNVRITVETGQADLGIAGKPASNPATTFEPLFRDRFKVVCCSCNPLARRKGPVRWSDLDTQNLILNGASERIEATGYRKLAERSTMTVRNVMSLTALAKARFGVTLLPALTTIDLPPGVVSLDLADASAEREVGLLRRSEATPSPVAAAFREHVLDTAPRLVGEFGLKKT